MITCPFCGETFEAEDLVFEFNWGDVATYFYNRKQLSVEPKEQFLDRAFYVTMKYDWRGNASMDTCSAVINPDRHPASDPLCDESNGWSKIVRLLGGKHIFEVECSREDRTMPTGARILPLSKTVKNGKKSVASGGMSTGMYCPVCEEQLKPEVLKVKDEIRILLCGRPGSGKTVYVTQVISEFTTGRLASTYNIEAANQSVHNHYENNKNRLKAYSGNFVLATNPNGTQDPYVYLLSHNGKTVRLVIQDIAGEDTANHVKYSSAVRRADMVLFFVDPWHIEEIRSYHRQNDDQSNAVVERSTQNQYTDLSGIFNQMLSSVDRSFTTESSQLAGILLIKGDYLNPPMLSAGAQPECQMMQQPIRFDNPSGMEFSIGMRSSFVRQCMNEWDSTRGFARQVENKYSAHNTRYFVSSALGQSTHVRQDRPSRSAGSSDNPDDQFTVTSSVSDAAETAESGPWDYDEQVLENAPRPQNVIDPILWCFKRKGLDY